MAKINSKHFLQIGPIIIGILLGYYAYRIHALHGLTDNIIRSDGTGYYAYLPAIFIYDDLQFDFLDNKELVNNDGGCRVQIGNGKTVNKYSCGLALLQLPFFLIAYFLSYLLNYPIDGYNPIFQHLFLIGNTVYFTIGLIFLNKILRLFKIQYWLTLLIIILFAVGNSILQYVTYDAYLSHSFSLGLMIMLVYLILKFKDDPKTKYGLWIGLIFGVLVLIRPFNLIAFIFLPTLFNSSKELLQFLKSISSHFLIITASFLLILSIQLLLWKAQTGNFITYSYGNENFIWGSHDFIFALFSYERGFFVYNPIWITVILFYLVKYKKIAFSISSLFIASAVLILLLSSWHSKLYGMCLGYRPLLEYQIFLLFPFLHLSKTLQLNNWKLFALLPGLSALCIWYTFNITAQYQQNIIPWGGPNKAQFWENFGQTDERYNYHFFLPPKLIKSNLDSMHIPFDESAIFSDTGFTFYPNQFTNNTLKGVGFYCDFQTSKPGFATGIFDFFHNNEFKAWKHKLISKDIKQFGKFSPYYVDDFIKDSSINKIVLKFINIREIEDFSKTDCRLVLYTEPAASE